MSHSCALCNSWLLGRQSVFQAVDFSEIETCVNGAYSWPAPAVRAWNCQPLLEPLLSRQESRVIWCPSLWKMWSKTVVTVKRPEHLAWATELEILIAESCPASTLAPWWVNMNLKVKLTRMIPEITIMNPGVFQPWGCYIRPRSAWMVIWHWTFSRHALSPTASFGNKQATERKKLPYFPMFIMVVGKS